MSKTIAQAQDLVGFIDRALQEYDQMTEGLVTMRAQYEMINRDPHLGRMNNPQTGAVVLVQAGDIASQIAQLAKRRTALGESIMEVVSVSDGSVQTLRNLQFQLHLLLERYEVLNRLFWLLEGPKDVFWSAIQNIIAAIDDEDLNTSFVQRNEHAVLSGADSLYSEVEQHLEMLLSQHPFDVVPVQPTGSLLIQ